MNSNGKHPNSASDDVNGDYEIGYAKPPKSARFRPGQSGNPAGRRKRVRNLRTDVQRTLKVPLTVKANDRPRTISTQEGALMVLRQKALQGDARALDRLLDLARLFNNDTGEIGPAEVLAREDQTILDAFRAEIATNVMRAAAPPHEEAANPALESEAKEAQR
jgi:hypothetical protein